MSVNEPSTFWLTGDSNKISIPLRALEPYIKPSHMLGVCCGSSLMPDGGFKASAANNAACRKSVDVFFRQSSKDDCLQDEMNV